MPKPKASADPFYAHELPGLDGLNAASASCKREEDVYRYIEEQNMGACEKVLYIMAKGSDTQRTTVLDHLHVCLEECTCDEIRRIVASLHDSLWQLEVAVQNSAANAFVVALPLLAERDSSLTVDLVDFAETMLQLKEERCIAPWSEVFVVLLKHLPQSVVEGRMVDLALKKGELSEPLHNRTLCCRLIGGFCERAPNAHFLTQFLEKTVELCQDTDFTVRATMCSHLAALTRTLGLKTTKDVLMTELYELLNDEEAHVARTAFCTLVEVQGSLDAPYRLSHTYPIVKGYVSKPPPALRNCLVQDFGRYIWAVKQDISEGGDEDALLFAKFFVGVCQEGDAEARRSCAFNIPAVCAALPLHLYATHLHAVLKGLSEDESVATRRCIASGLHEVCQLLGANAHAHLKGVFLALLEDDSPSVQEAVVGNLSTILTAFLPALSAPADRERYYCQAIPSLVRLFEAAAPSVARIERFHSHFAHFPCYYTAAQLHGTFLPLLLKQLADGPRALVPQCAQTVVLFCRRLQSSSLETDVFAKLIPDFGKSKYAFIVRVSQCCATNRAHTHRSYWHRLAFLEVCGCTLQLYSRRFFRERLLEHVFDLANDSVSAVRRRLCAVLPGVKRALCPPAGVEHLATLIQVHTH